jgi:hypothetical protein
MTSGANDLSKPDRTQAPTYQPQNDGQKLSAGTGPRATVSRPRYSTRRLLCGIWWALGTAICGISALISLFGGHFLQFIGAAAIAGLIGWYDYRIWTFRAKWLMFLIIF